VTGNDGFVRMISFKREPLGILSKTSTNFSIIRLSASEQGASHVDHEGLHFASFV
jgi:hypothetical protein